MQFLRGLRPNISRLTPPREGDACLWPGVFRRNFIWGMSRFPVTRVGDGCCSVGDVATPCMPCGWLVLTKTAPCRVITAKAMMTWQIMTRGLAQAGNRTSKTALCSQWWDCKPEWSVDASGPGNQCDCQLFSIWYVIDHDELLFSLTCMCTLGQRSLSIAISLYI